IFCVSINSCVGVLGDQYGISTSSIYSEYDLHVWIDSLREDLFFGILGSLNWIVSQGYDIVVFDRNIENKEKKVDMELGASAMDVIWTRDPSIFVLVSGDGDYFPVVKWALHHNWKVETWFWRSGVSGDFTECFSSFYSLDNYYKYFTYAYGQDPVGKNHILEITDGEMVGNWKGEEVIDCFFSLQLFGW
ncbi:12480_t:CDS:2, partial [Funneliformis caledonium]